MSATAARTRWLAVPIVALSVVGLAACGSSDSSASTTAGSSASDTASGTAAPDAKGEPAGMAAFHQCMSEHGVTRPARPQGAGGGHGGPPPGAAGAAGGPGANGAPGGPGPNNAAGGPGGAHHDPTKAPPGVDQNTWTTAGAACASLAPTPPAAPGN